MFSRPEIGKAIKVTTDWSDYTKYMVFSAGRHTLTGIVVANQEDLDDPNSFCLRTANQHFPVSAIPLARVIELEYVDGTEATTEDAVELPDMESWTVNGSKGNKYIVTRTGTTWTCECQGFTFRQNCKHVTGKKQEVLDRN